ncbi:hypothetical protein KPSA1_03331 [Pseudomonas syringae pv. actinidiae]|uniref:Uncharacterized protein n=1 Tax=Pseudomonas syringae pv. actinidiae TaxID=103796 RepID=A0A2V0QBD5_PSESF|nr:hypothetical protein KPSA1_03331 [Pseudomonas syringae pv. actinidiae]
MLVFIDVVRKGHFAGGAVVERDVEIERHQQFADNHVQAAKQFVHVTGLAGQRGDLEQGALQVLGALAILHFLAQRVVGGRQLLRAQRHDLLQVSAAQQAVQRHCHVPRDHGKQGAVLSAVDPGHVVDLHRHHAEHFIRSVLQGRTHPELGETSHTEKTSVNLRLLDTPRCQDSCRLSGFS